MQEKKPFIFPKKPRGCCFGGGGGSTVAGIGVVCAATRGPWHHYSGAALAAVAGHWPGRRVARPPAPESRWLWKPGSADPAWARSTGPLGAPAVYWIP